LPQIKDDFFYHGVHKIANIPRILYIVPDFGKSSVGDGTLCK